MGLDNFLSYIHPVDRDKIDLQNQYEYHKSNRIPCGWEDNLHGSIQDATFRKLLGENNKKDIQKKSKIAFAEKKNLGRLRSNM